MLTLICIIWSLLHILQQRIVLIYLILMMIEFFLQCLQFFSCNEQNNISKQQRSICLKSVMLLATEI
jgi:hypothetical protein